MSKRNPSKEDIPDQTAPRDDRLDAASLERILPDELSADEATGSETLRLHLERYEFARQNLVPGTLLDLACGVGYGTSLLAEDPRITSAVGVDISGAAVEYATRRYGSERVSYLCSAALEFLPGGRFDNIVSLETIEHVDDPKALFAHLVSLLAPGGRLIASVPVTPSVDANPHHKSNFSIKSFAGMGSRFSLRYITRLGQVQPFNPLAVMMKTEARTANLRRGLPSFYMQHPSHFALRMWSTLRHGFVNKYATLVWEK
jgi:SAM-dependent methyltransferase